MDGQDTSTTARTEELRTFLDSAQEFAMEAGEVTLRYFGGRVDSAAKGDGTPVTLADREAEELLRERITARFPDHGVLGEEYPETNPGARVRWILDPIDGTRSFMRGVPLYGVLVGIEVEGEAQVGVAHFPALNETVAAAKGLGCRWNGEEARVSEIKDLKEALVVTTDEERVRGVPAAEGWIHLSRSADFSRTWGDCYGHILVATGRAEIMVDPILSSWDCGPLLTILTEAGGRFTALDGSATIHGGSGISTNGYFHEPVLDTLRTGTLPQE